MKLTFSGASPYVRKALACAIARGIDGRLENLGLRTSDPALAALNPLAKIPTLVTPEGIALYDSPVICEYLDSVGDAPKLFPAAGPARWKALQLQALGDGIMDASQPRRREIGLPQDEGRQEYIATQRSKVERALDQLEAEADQLGQLATIGEIAVACALGYLDFRYQNEPWRAGHPKLEAWYAKVVALPALARTMPVA
ncbi:glutathione S-transferase C-terminal domain-containing protein [Roseococcus pinisoli]|uniref:Glutathione S-transferase N-terminal domain-containing protein n=1 Tax=Roseococcus pinisoli TaxID=2835040 RepID=A0ABS5QI25_9PROT|nr:glutathione S-transferase C-terminal domain-containing protein [Roseococcus pinisoli]MBS7813344.1 glutathione S-transferase N-terminal domain-containing protein [Roseococcus pinisoli]